MGYVLMGHGGMEIDRYHTSPDMETVAIPQGTRIQFYADAGQMIGYCSQQLDIWERLQAPWPPLDSSHVTYNLVLSNAEEKLADNLMNNPQFGGNEILLPGRNCPDPVHLCNGTPETCPTKPEQVAEGMTHHCDGILGILYGDLYWLACTSFSGITAETRPAVEATMGDRVRSVLLGENPDAAVSEAELHYIEQMNLTSLSYIDSEEVLPYVLAGPVILIGIGHGPFLEERLLWDYSGDTFHGQMRVLKGDGYPDWFDIYGVPQHKQGIVQAAIRRISMGADVVFH
ncbi:hypothetical protein ACFY2H_40440 [Streptomyces griseofuscus]|uniref:hypothetical protein n=1 Tax=Streptomyces griseofuscus TaxID=146922 RepID=UPI003684D770